MLRLVPTPIGNIEDITLRAIKALEDADIFLCEDTRVAKKLINLLKERFSLKIKTSKYISVHQHNVDKFLSQIEPSFFNQNIVYASDAGMPGISDPGSELIKYCIKNDIKYDVLPGASAFVIAYVASGYEGGFTFFGFLPSKGKERNEELQKVLNHPYISILYEAPHRLLKLLKEMSEFDSQREIFLAKELTKKYQKFYKDSVRNILETLQKETIKGEWVVIIPPKKKIMKESLISKKDILKLGIPKKDKAKLLSKLTEKSVKECYQELIQNSK